MHPRQLLGPLEKVVPVGGEGGRVNAPDRIFAERLAQSKQVARAWVARVIAAVTLRFVANEECDVVAPTRLPDGPLCLQEAAGGSRRHDVGLRHDDGVAQGYVGPHHPVAAPATLERTQIARVCGCKVTLEKARCAVAVECAATLDRVTELGAIGDGGYRELSGEGLARPTDGDHAVVLSRHFARARAPCWRCVLLRCWSNSMSKMCFGSLKVRHLSPRASK